MANKQTLLSQAFQLHQSGHIREAINLYEKLLQQQKNNSELLYLLGSANLQIGQHKRAIERFQRSLVLNPKSAPAHNNLGVALKHLRRLGEALASFNNAISLAPDFADAFYNRANTFHACERLDDALASFDQAIALKPGAAETHNNRGDALKGLKRLDEALASYGRAIALKPDYAEAHNNLGEALKNLGRPSEAEASYREAIALRPDLAAGHINLAATLIALGRVSEAEASCRQAIALEPDFAEAHNNLGANLIALGRVSEAEASCRQAIALKPDYSEAHNNLGIALKDGGYPSEAEASFRQALALKPGDTEAHSNLLFCMNYADNPSVMAAVKEALIYGENVSRKASNKFTSWWCSQSPDKLKLGFVSGDLLNHPVGYFLEGLLSHIDQSRFELIAYTSTPTEDELTARIKTHFKLWRPLFGKSDEAAAKLIHNDGVHILIDLAGHTGHNQLPVFAHKPAPVQLTWLGYCGTTGVQEIDYLLGDAYATPVSEDNQFIESIWRMPESYICLTPPSKEVKIDTPPFQLNGYVTFGSFNNLPKVTDAVVALWARILSAVEHSRLLLKAKQFNDQRTVHATLARFLKCGITADRLVIEGTKPTYIDHLEAYNRVDIALDTFPYNGVTTSAEAMWMGVPVITKRGDRFIAHNGETIAINSGQSGWIAQDENDYVLKAKLFASDLNALAKTRSCLRAQVLASPLFDSKRFARHFEDAMTKMWQARQEGHLLGGLLQA